MGYVHRCPWCGWSREAQSPTMLEPRCRECGGLLEAVPESVQEPRAAAGFHVATPHLTPAFGRLLKFALVALMMFAAARIGWEAGGVWLALTGVGVVGLFTVSLVVD